MTLDAPWAALRRGILGGVQINYRMLAFGIASYVPGVYRLLRRGTGGTADARYCYSVWLRHLVLNNHEGLIQGVPQVVAELGPGDSLGLGLAALLCGVRRYWALDAVDFTSRRSNLAVFDELVELFRSRAPIPGRDEYPEIRPALADRRFPSSILDKERLASSLSPARVARLRDEVAGLERRPLAEHIRFVAPWDDPALIEEGSVEMAFSQAVLEHVDDLPGTYGALFRWLKPGGVMSHAIDYRSHRCTRQWNGHWAYPPFLWRLLRGRRGFFLNRAPHSTHLRLVREAGFTALCDQRESRPSEIARAALAAEFCGLGDEDLSTCTAFLQACKPAQ